MDKTNDKNTPGGRPDIQENPHSTEVGPKESGEDQLLLNTFARNYRETNNDGTIGVSEITERNQFPFQSIRKLSRSPMRSRSTVFMDNSKEIEQRSAEQHQNSNALFQESYNRSPNEQMLFNAWHEANRALRESNNLNKQLKEVIVTMQEQITTLDSEMKALKTKENINNTSDQKGITKEYFTDEEELAEETEWVRMKNIRKKKRKRNDTPTPPHLKEIASKINQNVPVKDAAPKVILKEPKKIPPPPPIILDGVSNYDSFYEQMKTVVSKDKFNTKLMNRNNLKINVNDEESYRTVTKMLCEGDHAWHSYENKQTRPIRVMAKNLHSTCKPEKIVDDLKAQGFNAVEASIKLKRQSKEPLNMFMLTFSSNDIIEHIYKIKNILGCKVDIQPLRKSKIIPQCKRCQGYEHTQKYCNKEPRCVKCPGRHLTKDCDKPKEARPKCVHCGENHPANYRGCSVAIELQKIKNKNMRDKRTNIIRNQTIKEKQPEMKEKQKPKAYAAPQGEIGKMTYAQVTKKANIVQNDDIKQQLQLIINKLNIFDERLQKLEYSNKGAIPKQQNYDQ